MIRTGASEHLLALHLEQAAELAVQGILGAAVGVEVPAEQLSGSVDGLDHGGSRTVGEEDGGVAIGPVGDACEGVGADERGSFRRRSR